jgi:hypothetical protein
MLLHVLRLPRHVLGRQSRLNQFLDGLLVGISVPHAQPVVLRFSETDGVPSMFMPVVVCFLI